MIARRTIVVGASLLLWIGAQLALGASPLAKMITSDADAALEVAQHGDFDAARAQAHKSLDLAIAYGSGRDIDAFRAAAFSCRLLNQLQPLESPAREDLLGYLRSHLELARMLAFSVKEGNDVKGVYTLLDQLRKQRPAQVRHCQI